MKLLATYPMEHAGSCSDVAKIPELGFCIFCAQQSLAPGRPPHDHWQLWPIYGTGHRRTEMSDWESS